MGIEFTLDSCKDILTSYKHGITINAPSGPGLASDFHTDPVYRKALLTADVNITDSGFMVLLWLARTGILIKRQSGLKFLRDLLSTLDKKEIEEVFWISPSVNEREKTINWLLTSGFNTTADNFYVAPIYPNGEIQDHCLFEAITRRSPKNVIIAIGGGVQERLAYCLREHANEETNIFCLGAAIAFLTGAQVHIPNWADKLFLGWLYRIVSSPNKYARRYYDALKLAPKIFIYRDSLPPLYATYESPYK